MKNEVYKLRKSIEWEGKKIEELKFDFESLTGLDMINIEREMTASGIVMIIQPEFNQTYQVYTAAAAAKLDYDIIPKLSASDYVALMKKGRNFLTNMVF